MIDLLWYFWIKMKIFWYLGILFLYLFWSGNLVVGGVEFDGIKLVVVVMKKVFGFGFFGVLFVYLFGYVLVSIVGIKLKIGVNWVLFF